MEYFIVLPTIIRDIYGCIAYESHKTNYNYNLRNNSHLNRHFHLLSYCNQIFLSPYSKSPLTKLVFPARLKESICQPCEMAFLANERLRGSNFLTQIRENIDSGSLKHEVKFLANLPVDILIPDVSPSLAILIIEAQLYKRDKPGTTGRLTNLQKRFANLFAIFISLPASDMEELNLSLPLGSVRIVHVQSYNETIAAATKIITIFRDTKKLNMQDSFFQRERDTSLQGHRAHAIAQSTLSGLVNIPDADSDLLIDALPSLSTIILKSQDPDLANSSPAELDSIMKLKKFFKS